MGCGCSFFGCQQFLDEFLPRARAGEFDGDVVVGFEAGQADKVAGEVDYFYWGAHVEDEDFAALGEGAGLEDELRGFGDGHEVALHVGMGDGDRAAGGDLFFEEGDDAATAAEDVAEADGGESGGAYAVEVLDDHFGDAFGGAHDAGGVYGFVGGDHDEDFRPVAVGRFGDGLGAEDVVVDGFFGLPLHEGDVLVGGGVEDDLWPGLGEDGVDALPVADVGDFRHEAELGVLGLEFAVDFIDAIFAFAEKVERFWCHRRYLPAEFGADGASRSGDEDAFAGEVAGDLR